MITLFGTSLSATTPWLLLAIPAAASLLIYTFRARGSSSSTVTSSLFLLSKLPLHLSARKTFLPPLQFWIELLAFLALSVAAAGLTASRVGQRIAIVVDSSLSMSARNATQSTKLDDAKRLAQADISRAPANSRFAVFSADSELRPITQGAVSSWSAGESVHSISPTHASDSLGSTISSLFSGDSFDSVWVYTDKKNAEGSESSRLRVTTIPPDQALAHNIWIHSASVLKTEGNTRLRVELFSSDDRSSRPTLRASCTSGNSESSFTPQSVTAVVTRSRPVTLELGPLQPAWDFCTISLVADPQGPADAIELDNTAYVVNSNDSSAIRVAGSLTPLALGLTQLSDYSFEPETAQIPAGSVPSLFHRATPRTRPTSASLVIFPPEGPLPWRGGSASSPPGGSVEISRWVETHPLMRYAQPHLLSIPSARVLSCPDSATAVIYSTYGPLVCAGEEAGARYVIVGFELLPFDGMKSPTVSVITLNALYWLFRDPASAASSSEIYAKLLTSGAQLSRLAPERVTRLPNQQAELPQRPGVFELTSTTLGSSTGKLVALNSISDEESDLAAERSVNIPPAGTGAASRDADDLALGGYLAALGLFILCIDLARRLRRPAQWGNV